MRIFHCDHCDQPIFFENTCCGKCGHKLAYLPDLQLVASLDPTGKSTEVGGPPTQIWTSPANPAKGKAYRLCENYTKYNVCNWAILSSDPSTLCPSCRLTRVIPDLSKPGNQDKWCRLEVAKRRLVYALIEFGLPLRDRVEDATSGLEFRFLGDPDGGPRVLTGHDGGIITMNIAEADDVERERARISMHDPYRTLLGHFRHEIGHYYWDLLLRDSTRMEEYRKLFGDERADYNSALQAHYANGPRPNWPENFVTAYASVHPWEDWAETWAHYFHMTDALETAAVCGLSLKPARRDEPVMEKPKLKPADRLRFDEIITNWFPLTYVLNNLNRGMGLPDAYPFVLPPPTIAKLRFVHETVCQAGNGKPKPVTQPAAAT